MQYENLAISSACEAVLEIGNAGNLYINERAPWSLLKQGGDAFEAATKVLSRQPYLESFNGSLNVKRLLYFKFLVSPGHWLEILKIALLSPAIKSSLLQ